MHSSALDIQVLRLLPGQDLKQELEAFLAQAQIEAGWVMSCVGSLSCLCLRFANQDAGETRSGFFEILSLSGTLSIHGCHLHLCAADGSGQAWGGHLLAGNRIYTTAEIVIGSAAGLVFTREQDGTTPWRELQVRARA
jgi:hypothetical protein